MWPGLRLRFHAKRKGGQAIENKQLCEMVHFAPPMISRTYDQRRETARFARRKNPFAFAGFSASSRSNTQGSEINDGFGARVADVARVCDSEMAPQAVGIAQNRLGIGPRRLQPLGGRIDQANPYETFCAQPETPVDFF
jgi:hypothetical protein